MDRRIFLTVLGATLLALAAGILIPPFCTKPAPPSNLPWQVRVTEGGGVQVFGITLGETTLGEAEKKLVSEGEITMFNSPEGRKSIEAYFDNVNLSGLAAKLVMAVRLPQEDLQAIYDRGVLEGTLGSGTQKIRASSEDLKSIRAAPIATLTYMPGIQLSRELIAKRFGEPAEKWREKETQVEHWLYPQIGLDVAFSEREKEVLQYVPPADFERLRAPLIRGERVVP